MPRGIKSKITNQKINYIEEIIKNHCHTRMSQNKLMKDLVGYELKNDLINKICSKIPRHLNYLEVGTHKGGTLLPAAFGNNIQCHGVDLFMSTYGGIAIKDTLLSNIEKLKLDNVHIHQEDGNEFLINQKLKNVKCYLYDAEHNYQSTVDGILFARNCLCDEAYVLVDDVPPESARPPKPHQKNLQPWDAASFILKKHSDEFKLLRHFEKEEFLVMKYTRISNEEISN